MKRFLILLSILFCNMVYADTINLHWRNYDGTAYQNSTCVIDSDLILPSTPPTKYGYTFTGWKMSNYVPIEYLESTGTQYIDTGIRQLDYAQNLILSATFQFATTTEIINFVLGAASPSTSQYFVPFATNSTYGTFVSNVGRGGTELKLLYADTTKHIATCDTINGILLFDGIGYTYTSNIARIPYNIYLFGRNQDGTAQKSKVRIYDISISSSGGLLRDFIPVLDENGTPCMYDRVERKFYYNQGTGQFIAGPILQ